MKCNNVYGALMILVLALIVSVPMTQAQARVRANVPFDFSLDQKSMPAGAYEISSMSDKVLVVRNLDTREARLVIEPMHVEASRVCRHSACEAGIPQVRRPVLPGADLGRTEPHRDRLPRIEAREGTADGQRQCHQPEIVVIAMK